MYFCRRMNVFYDKCILLDIFMLQMLISQMLQYNYIAAETKTKVKLPELY